MLPRRINWTNLTFFVLTPSASIVGIIWRLQEGGIPWPTWVLAVAMAFATGLGITAGYHRLYSHKSYDAAWPVRLVLLLLGGATFEASARWWCSEHRYHHRYVDTDRDPYGINKGFWYAHIGWLVARRDREIGFANIKDLDKDPLIRWQHRYYLPLAVLFCFGLPTGVAAFWGDPWGGLVVAGFARLVFVQHFTWCINSVAHTFGRQTYSDRHSGKDSGLMALFTYGEGYHNFHHEFPSDYRNGHCWYHWDPAKWLIRCLAVLRLSRGLRQTEREKILQARLLMERKRAIQRWALQMSADSSEATPVVDSRTCGVEGGVLGQTGSSGARQTGDACKTLPVEGATLAPAIDRALAHCQSAARRWVALKTEYAELKQAKLQSITDRIQDLRRELRQARREFRRAIAAWKNLLRSPLPVT